MRETNENDLSLLSSFISFLSSVIRASLLHPLFQIIVHIFLHKSSLFLKFLLFLYRIKVRCIRFSRFLSVLRRWKHFFFDLLFKDVILFSFPIWYLYYAAERSSFIFYFYPISLLFIPLSPFLSLFLFLFSHTSFPFLLYTFPSFPSPSQVCHSLFLSQPDKCSVSFLLCFCRMNSFFVSQVAFFIARLFFSSYLPFYWFSKSL